MFMPSHVATDFCDTSTSDAVLPWRSCHDPGGVCGSCWSSASNFATLDIRGPNSWSGLDIAVMNVESCNTE